MGSTFVHFQWMKMRSPIGLMLAAWLIAAAGSTTAQADEAAPPPAGTQPVQPAITDVETNPLQQRIAEYRGKAQGIQTGETVRSAESTARLAARATEISGLQAQLSEALAMPPASPERGERIDETFSALQRLVDRLRDDRNQAIEAMDTAIEERDRWQPTPIDEPGQLPELNNAVDEYRTMLQSRVEAVQQEIDLASAHLSSARSLRRRAQSHASEASQERARTTRLQEAASEVRSIPIDVQSTIRRTVGEWWQAPKQINQIQALGSLFLGLMELALLLIVGMAVHQRIPQWIRLLLQPTETDSKTEHWATHGRFPAWMVAGDVRALNGVLGPIVQDLLVLGLSVGVMLWLAHSIPLAAWIALLFAAGASIRLAQGAVELALITPTENRPALKVTEESVRQAIVWVVHAFGLLLAIEIALTHLLVDILAADRVAELVGEIAFRLNALLAVVGLVRWGDTIRARVAAGGADSGLSLWVVNSGSRRMQSLVGSAVGFALLALRLALGILQGLVDSRAGLSWVSAALARRQLRDDSSTDRRPLPLATRNAIGQGSLRSLHVQDYVARIHQCHAEWKTEPRRGLVAITGDRGCGKSIVMDALRTALDGPVTSASAPIGTTTEIRALNWLIDAAQLQASPNTESVVAALSERPPSVFLLSNLHRLYLRTVGGYGGLDAVLAVMQATGRHHFWVASFHGPAWSFLAGMNHIGNVGIFPTRLHLKPIDPADLSTWLLGQTRSAGFAPRFDGMLQRQAQGPDRARLLERTERAYWRLLAEASMGNPTVAVRLWVDGLRATDDPTVLDVLIPKTHDSDELTELEDSELFALTAIILHEDLNVEEMQHVLNMPIPRVRALFRGLEQRSLITETETGRYKVRLNWLPAVERFLRRRSYLHKS